MCLALNVQVIISTNFLELHTTEVHDHYGIHMQVHYWIQIWSWMIWSYNPSCAQYPTTAQL